MVGYPMPHMGLTELRERLEEVMEDIGYGEETLRQVRADITRIASDLAEDPTVFCKTMKKLPGEYPEWRRRAKSALNHRRKDAHALGNKMKDLRDEQQRLENLISAEESSYQGDDPKLLLSAMTRILLRACRNSGHRLSREEEGVVNAARVSLGLLDKPFA